MTLRVACFDRLRPPMTRSAAHPGFTLLELVTALAIAAVVAALGLPGYRAYIADLELRDRVEALVEALSFARAEAIKRGIRVDLCPTSDGELCADHFGCESCWVIF
jgi:type IV fimbrial biogenesis protein FimT